MARLITYTLLAALSMLAIASPIVLPRQTSSTPNNVAPGTIIAGCGLFHTVAPGETCALLEQEFNITDGFFHAVNPEINSGCTNLIAGEDYCIQLSALRPPRNIAPGTTTTGCAQYHTVQSGETCNIIATPFNTTFPAFLSLNPEVNSGCTNLIIGDAYCVQSVTSI